MSFLNFTGISNEVIVSVIATAIIGIFFFFLKKIRILFKKILNRARHHFKPSQCFARHTLELKNLVRKKNKMFLEVGILRGELDALRLESFERNEKLRQEEEKLLRFAMTAGDFTLEKVVYSGMFDAQMSELILGRLVDIGFLEKRRKFKVEDLGYEYSSGLPLPKKRSFGFDVYSITTQGRTFLYELGIYTAGD